MRDMGEDMRLHAAAATLLTLAASIASGAALAADDGFYKGRNVSVVVGFSPGGGFDAYARVFARHLGAHIPGNPDVIVENMPGAGSLTAVRYLDSTAPKDGTVMVTFNQGLIIQALTDPGHVKLDMRNFDWVGSISSDFRICYAWAATGIKSWADVLKRPQFTLGSTSKSSSNYIDGSILRVILRAPVKQIMGFPGSADQRIAIERGELDGDCGTWSSIPANWIRDAKINPIIAFTTQRTPDMPKIPFAGDLASTKEDKARIEFMGASNAVAKPYIMSKSTPPARLATMRKAFDETMKDKDFLADAAKANLPVYPVDGRQAQAIVAKIDKAAPQLVAEAKKVME
jgi:tripartite-type tricarboxylate transporter receptor subunit TctC